VVTASLKELGKKNVVVIPGRLNRIIRYLAENPIYKGIVKKMVINPPK
jgi:hypothetical protein